MQQSRRGRNQLSLLARPILSRSPHRSMSASSTRPVPRSIPSLLSIAARPHEDGLISSWRADSLAFVWLDPGITPCCKSHRADAVELEFELIESRRVLF